MCGWVVFGVCGGVVPGWCGGGVLGEVMWEGVFPVFVGVPLSGDRVGCSPFWGGGVGPSRENKEKIGKILPQEWGGSNRGGSGVGGEGEWVGEGLGERRRRGCFFREGGGEGVLPVCVGEGEGREESWCAQQALCDGRVQIDPKKLRSLLSPRTRSQRATCSFLWCS